MRRSPPAFARPLAFVALLALLAPAAADTPGPGPLLDLMASTVAPGEAVEATLLGPPGHFFAVAGSRTNRGLVVHGVAFDLGPDARIVATGELDLLGRARVTLPPLDDPRPLYLQAVTAPTPDFLAFAVTPAKRVWVTAAPGLLRLAPGAPTAGPADGATPGAEPGPTADRDAPAPLAPQGRVGSVLACLGCVFAQAIAPGAIGAAQINTAEVQARVSGACPAGRAIRAVGLDGTVTCDTTTALDPAFLATLRWDLLPRAAGSPFPTGGNSALGVAFDGTHIWVANRDSNSVAKLRADTGAPASGSPFPTGGNNPRGVAFDGTHVWVTHVGSSPGTVAKLRADTGAPAPDSPFPTGGAFPEGVAFDGTHVWVANTGSNTIARLRADTGVPALFSPIPTGGNGPSGVAFDGTHVWVTHSSPGTVAKLRADTGFHVLGSPFPTGVSLAGGIAFDGTHVWVTQSSFNVPGHVVKLRADTGEVLGSPFTTGGNSASGVAFDGTHVWVAHGTSPGSVAKLAPRRRRTRRVGSRQPRPGASDPDRDAGSALSNGRARGRCHWTAV